MKLLFIRIITVFLLVYPAWAQAVGGRISGTVTDASGSVVPGAKVEITNVDTQASRSATTDENGFYLVTNLPVGTYAIGVEAAGFRKSARPGMQLVSDGRVTADFQLQVGESTQTVEVVAATVETVNTTSGEVARVIDSEQVQNLALNGRNYIQLATLIPGSVITDADQMNVTTSLSATTQNINGNRGNSTSQLVDGAFNLVAGSNGSVINNVGVDFISQVKIQSSNFSAEYGRTSGAAVNLTTKSGTNQFHGSAFEFFRNDVLDARNFFSPSRPKLRFNDFGWSLGGPILKNKLFFFAGQEWKKIRRETQPARKTLPTSAQLDGDLRYTNSVIYYPGTTTPIPGNVLPASMITTDGRALANVYRRMATLATSFADQPVSNNAIYQLANPFNFREDIIRLDYTISSKHTVWGRYIGDDFNLIEPLGTFSSGLLPTVPTNRIRPGRSWALGWTFLVSPNLIVDVRGSANWASQRIPPAGDNWQRSSYGFSYPQLFPGGSYPDGIPDVTLSNYTGFQGPSFALLSPSTDLQASAAVTWIKGSHVLKGGFTTFRDRIDQNGRPAYTGQLNFSTGGNSMTTGNVLADMLTGQFRTYTEASGDPMGFFRFSQQEFFVQDNYRVSSRLSFEIGMRYQYGQPIYTQADNIVNFDPSLYNPANAVVMNADGTIVPGSGNRYNGLIRAGSGIPPSELPRVDNATSPDIALVPTGAPRGLYNAQHRFAPRFGFAFALDNRTSIRGGYGIFYDRPEGNIIFSAVNTPPYLSNATYENGNVANPAAGKVAALAPFGSISTIDPNLQTPYSQQYSFTVQRELGSGVFLETGYVGNLGRHLLRQPDINLQPFELLAANAALPSSQRVSTNVLRPYKGYSNIRQYSSDSTSNYHALQVFLSKRQGRVNGTLSYTYSKSLADTSGNGDNPENYQNRHFSYGPTSFDRRQILVLTSTVTLPQLRNSNAVLKNSLGGWELSGIGRLQSGQHLTPTGNTSIGGRRADLTGQSLYLPDDERSVNGWLNRAGLSSAPDSRYGNAGVGVISGPGKQIFDISLRKYVNFTDRVRLRIQADCFNLANIANFGNPNVNVTDVNFTTITAADPGRNIQLGLKVTF